MNLPNFIATQHYKRNVARTGRSTSQHKQATEPEKTKPKKRPQKDKERENEGTNGLGERERERNTPVANGNEQDQRCCWNSSWFHNSNSRSGLRKTKPHNPFSEVKLPILLTAYVRSETETKNSKLKTTTAFQNRFKRRQEERESKMSKITTTTMTRKKRRRKRAIAMKTRAMA